MFGSSRYNGRERDTKKNTNARTTQFGSFLPPKRQQKIKARLKTISHPEWIFSFPIIQCLSLSLSWKRTLGRECARASLQCRSPSSFFFFLVFSSPARRLFRESRHIFEGLRLSFFFVVVVFCFISAAIDVTIKRAIKKHLRNVSLSLSTVAHNTNV